VTTTDEIRAESLTELALNLCSSWHHGADELWMELDPLELDPPLLENRPGALLALAAHRALEVPLEISRDAVVVDQSVVHVDQEHDQMVARQRRPPTASTGLCPTSSP